MWNVIQNLWSLGGKYKWMYLAIGLVIAILGGLYIWTPETFEVIHTFLNDIYCSFAPCEVTDASI